MQCCVCVSRKMITFPCQAERRRCEARRPLGLAGRGRLWPSDDDGDGDDGDDDDDDDEDDDGDGGYRISVSSHARKKYHTQGIVVPLLASGKD